MNKKNIKLVLLIFIILNIILISSYNNNINAKESIKYKNKQVDELAEIKLKKFELSRRQERIKNSKINNIKIGNPITKIENMRTNKIKTACFNLNSNIYTINNEVIYSDFLPININGNAFLPIKLITTMMNIEPKYIEEDNNVFLQHEDFNVIIFTNTGEIAFEKDNEIKILDSLVIKHNNINYVPIKVFENIGINVFWDELNNTIHLKYNK